MVEARGRTTRTSLVVVRLLVAGESHHLLTRTGKLDGWSMVTAPLKYEEGLDWHRAAVRGAEEQLAPLRVGEDFHLVPLSDEPLSWVSKSIGATTMSYQTTGTSTSRGGMQLFETKSTSTTAHLSRRELMTPDEIMRLDSSLEILLRQGEARR